MLSESLQLNKGIQYSRYTVMVCGLSVLFLVRFLCLSKSKADKLCTKPTDSYSGLCKSSKEKTSAKR